MRRFTWHSGHEDVVGLAVQRDDGDWVRFADVEPLLAELELLRAVEEARRAAPAPGRAWSAAEVEAYGRLVAAEDAVEAFRAGGQSAAQPAPVEPPSAEIIDLMGALKASLRAGGGG